MNRRKRHELLDILGVTIFAVVAGAESWTDVELFGKSKLAWLRRFLKLDNGIPSHDTFGRVFAMLDPSAFEQAFIRWTRTLAGCLDGVVALDGKTVRRSHNAGANQNPIHMVSAWAHANGIVLGQVKVNEKSNEITAIPELLERLALNGCIVTIDAMGCQRAIAKTILDRGADYVLAVKGNQAALLDDIERHFADTPAQRHDYERTVEKDHGRVETRECWVSQDAPADSEEGHWPSLNAAAMVRATVERDGKTCTDTRYYITSLATPTAKTILGCVRAHWDIENSLHWVLDVTFNEDQCRVRTQNAAQNFVILRHIALNLIKSDKTFKGSVRGKRKRAAWDTPYLEHLLAIFVGEKPN